MKKKITIIIVICLLITIFSMCVSAEGEILGATEPEESVPTSNIYDIIKDCWQYILPEEVINDNANIITMYTIKATSIIVLAPLALIFIILPLCILTKRR